MRRVRVYTVNPVQEKFEHALWEDGRFVFMPMRIWEDLEEGRTVIRMFSRINGGSFAWRSHELTSILERVVDGELPMLRPNVTDEGHWELLEKAYGLQRSSGLLLLRHIQRGTVMEFLSTSIYVARKGDPRDQLKKGGSVVAVHRRYSPQRILALERRLRGLLAGLRQRDPCRLIRVAKTIRAFRKDS